MRLRSHAPLAREILLELLHSLALERPFVAWKKINRRKSLGRTDGSNNYGDKEHLHKCLSERERKYLKKVGPENEETSSPCNELEIFPSSSSSSTWPRSSLPASYRANLLWQTSRNVEKKEEEKLIRKTKKMKSRNTRLLFNRFVLRAELIKKRERENGKEGGNGNLEKEEEKEKEVGNKEKDSVDLVVVVRFEKFEEVRWNRARWKINEYRQSPLCPVRSFQLIIINTV